MKEYILALLVIRLEDQKKSQGDRQKKKKGLGWGWRLNKGIKRTGKNIQVSPEMK